MVHTSEDQIFKYLFLNTNLCYISDGGTRLWTMPCSLAVMWPCPSCKNTRRSSQRASRPAARPATQRSRNPLWIQQRALFKGSFVKVCEGWRMRWLHVIYERRCIIILLEFFWEVGLNPFCCYISKENSYEKCQECKWWFGPCCHVNELISCVVLMKMPQCCKYTEHYLFLKYLNVFLLHQYFM